MNNENRWKKGRGNTKFYFTYNDLSKITGLSVGTLRNYSYQKRFNPKDLMSITIFLEPYVTKYLAKD